MGPGADFIPFTLGTSFDVLTQGLNANLQGSIQPLPDLSLFNVRHDTTATNVALPGSVHDQGVAAPAPSAATLFGFPLWIALAVVGVGVVLYARAT